VPDDSNGLTIDYAPSGRNGTGTVTARLDGRAVAVETIDLGKPDARAAFARQVCDGRPGIDLATVEGELLQIAADVAGGGDGESQASRLVRLADDCELWHDARANPWASLRAGEHVEHWPVRSRTLKRHLAQRFFAEVGKAPCSQAVQDALTVIEGKALFEGDQYDTHVRVAGHNGKLYVDLAGPDWQAVEVGPDGWRLTTTPPVRFRRAGGMVAMPVPVAGGRLDELRRFVHVDPEAWPLLAGWLLGAIAPRGPYPVLVLHGEQGSGKSTAAAMLRALVDPSEAPLRTAPRDERDLAICANNGWVVSLDNVSGLPPWLSDALCRLSTGGGFSTRELYSDAEEVIFSATRPVILNGIAQAASRGDLLDRALLVEALPIPERDRLPERELWAAFDAAKPRILGGLLDAAAAALDGDGKTRPARLPRMADFAMWVSAGETALGLADGEFLAAYQGNRQEAVEVTIESAPIGPALLRLLAGGDFSGSAADLLAALESEATDREQRAKGWPTSARGVAGAIRRLAPALRGYGYDVETGGHVGRGRDKRPAFTLRRRIEKDGEQRAPRAPHATGPENTGPGGAHGAHSAPSGAHCDPPANPEKNGNGAHGAHGAHCSQPFSDEVMEWTG
jgi:energy-coupling factor transporter ATP-binding protein EcfA2